ncbi:hypothetical protein C8Q73DRAFT_785988 [Cubamyces lactineus]|nr:hypothetical protein C8Q73DRAFT_785988 [Cubamyces lactineus]
MPWATPSAFDFLARSPEKADTSSTGSGCRSQYVDSEEFRLSTDPNTPIRFDSLPPPTQYRVAMADVYVGISCARSVNDILMAAYDVLEAHRKILRLGRTHGSYTGLDPSTILVSSGLHFYPRVCEMGELGPRGLFVDFDAHVSTAGGEVQPSLVRRFSMARPIYAARAVAASREVPAAKTLLYKKMPSLSVEAKSLYIKLHGESRYNRYCDDLRGDTYHGGVRPSCSDADDLADVADALPFYHHPRYDAESVFWTLYATLLRVLPRGGVETEISERALRRDWAILTSHAIPDEGRLPVYRDQRNALLDSGRYIFITPFLPEMQDVADLLLLMVKQVLPSYALMTSPPPFYDHLHEALQRLILEYLVSHEANPIPLTVGALRPAGRAVDLC